MDRHNIVLNNFSDGDSLISFTATAGNVSLPFMLQMDCINTNVFFDCLYGKNVIEDPFNEYAKLPIFVPAIIESAALLVTTILAGAIKGVIL